MTRRAPSARLRGLPPLVAVAAWLVPGLLAAQATTMPSTLRYGSGLIDIPVSSVLPHLQVTSTFSGFFLRTGSRQLVDDDGATVDFGPGVDEFFSDASVAVGLYDRFETGVSVQALGNAASGGDVWGLFGRVKVWEPIDEGLGLAVGGRWLTSPSFGDGLRYRPGRLGFPDPRLRRRYSGNTNLSLYGVATAFVHGFDGGPLPPNDLTFTLGVGSGMFGGPGALPFYSSGHSNGWFAGAGLHVEVAQGSMLTLMAEHNGFDVNVGAHFDWEGARVGAQWLASNHDWPADGHSSEYEKPKLGLLASFAICPTRRGLRCRPRRMERVVPDTIWIPPPPPDTVIVTVAAEGVVPEGEEATICLSTGRNVPIRVTATGDTLVAPAWVSVSEMAPNVALAGDYAGEAFWYRTGGTVQFEGRQFYPGTDTFPIDCSQILRVGAFEGVPLFAVLSAERPLSMLFVPVAPGVWRRFERGGGRP